MSTVINTRIVDLHNKDILFDIYIGRRVEGVDWTYDSKWGNYFHSLDDYEIFVCDNLWDDLDELKNKILGCWCLNTHIIYPIICHGQILLKLLKEKFNIKIIKFGELY